MSAIVWDAAGSRGFIAGVDRGVLYVPGFSGVPWNGLVSVKQNNRDSINSYYIDGVKYFDHVTVGPFEGSLEAFTYPDEFEVCDGSAEVANGLFAKRQGRKSFGLSYRSLVGNDLEGVDHGYEIHILYNVKALGSNITHSTLDSSIDARPFSWSLYAKPAMRRGVRPTSHFVISSVDTPADLLNDIEDILYGTDTTQPRLPSSEELFFLFENYSVSSFDAGYLVESYFNTLDAGDISEPQTETIDAGGP